MNPDRVGRDGLLRLRFERSGSQTILSQCRYTLPLQALTAITLEDGAAYLMLLNPTGGMLGGDRLLTEITLEANASVCLSTPSAARVYRAAGGAAIQETRIDVKEGASLEYLPGHLIPHAGAALRQSLRIEMAAGSKAVISDSLAAGRVAHGERWSFRELDSGIEVLMRGQPVFISHAKIEPGAA
ncbi:MAG: urease accessory protein UreD, partial [Acidobacteriota bacterium]|nr:urease accessory protein UreD [Acidobacteriota bacterium]